MKAITLLATLTLSSQIFAKTMPTLEFSINAVNSANGKLYVQLFRGKDNFKNNQPAAAQIVPANTGDTLLVFPNLVPGEYAVRYFHDENNDGDMATNLFGMPTEGYGFSNNAQPNMGPASFEDAKFNITGDDQRVQNASKVIY